MSNHSVAFVQDTLSRPSSVEHCMARFAATGMVTQFAEFMRAEAARGTKPSDLLAACAILQGSMLSTLLDAVLKQDSRLAATDQFLAAFSTMVRQNTIKAPAVRP
ncbi:MAG: hypothetical protein ACREDO_04595 [Methyloceanibacter sp.]